MTLVISLQSIRHHRKPSNRSPPPTIPDTTPFSASSHLLPSHGGPTYLSGASLPTVPLCTPYHSRKLPADFMQDIQACAKQTKLCHFVLHLTVGSLLLISCKSSKHAQCKSSKHVQSRQYPLVNPSLHSNNPSTIYPVHQSLLYTIYLSIHVASFSVQFLFSLKGKPKPENFKK